MMVWKLATRPAQATSASTRAFSPCPKMVWKPRKSGSLEVPIFAAPGAIPALSTTVRNETTISVSSP